MKNRAREIFEGMTLEQKLGQLIVSYHDNEDDIRGLARRGALGGLYSVPGDTVREAAAWVADLQKEAPIPLLICSDFERGNPFAGGTPLPPAMAVGATRDPDLAREAGRVTAREAKAMGYRLLGSPVADVNNNPLNPIINIRSYGEDPDLVARMAVAYAMGVQAEGLCACLKHFPGHGDTDADSHRLLASLPHDMERMERVELLPFRAGIEAGVKSIMTAHLVLSALDDERPATLSRPVLTGLLRDRMNFGGIILSDAMAMHAIAHNYGFDEALAAAIEAGCDVVIPSESMRTFEAITKGYRDGAISPRRVEESVMRILELKESLSLPEPIPDPDDAESVAGDPRHRQLARRIAEASIACGGDSAQFQPLRPDRAGPITLVTISNYDCPSEDAGGAPKSPPEWLCLENALRERFRIDNVHHVTPSAQPPIEPRPGETIVIGVFVHVIAYSQAGGVLPEGPKAALEAILAKAPTGVVLSFGNPYPLAQLKGLGKYLCAFSDAEVSIEAAARVLAGDIPPWGALPDSLNKGAGN